MIKTLRPVGNSLGLIIDRPILELLGIDRQTRLRVTTDGKVLYIEPVASVAGDGPDDTSPLNRAEDFARREGPQASGW